MASPSSAASCLNAQPSAMMMRRSSASAFARGDQGGGMAPLRAAVSGRRRLAAPPVRAAAANNPPQWTPPSNTKTSPYTSPSGRGDMPGPRDMYEGTTGIDVLAMQKDLVAEGYLTPSDATGVFTPATRASVETLQQQYGLPINGVWGSLERQLFDNARIRTLPPQSAEALLPPDYNKSRKTTTTGTKYATTVSSNSRTQHLMPKSLKMPGAEIPAGFGGVVTMAGAGLFTAAVITKADSKRRQQQRGGGAAGGAPHGFKPGATRGAIGSLMDKLTGRGGGRHNDDSNNDYYQQQAYYDQQMAAEFYGGGGQMNMQQQQQRGWVDGGGKNGKSGGGRWFNAHQAQAPDSFDPFPGGYPIPPAQAAVDDNYGGPAAHPPLRPGDRRRMEMEAEMPGPKYHPAFDRPDGSANQSAQGGQPPPPPPPTTPPPPHVQQQRQQQQGWPEFGNDDWTGDDMGPPQDYLISSTDINAARNGRNGNNNNGGPSSMKNGGGGRGGGGGAGAGGGGRPVSRTTASVPPYGGWGGGLGPASVPEYGGADNARAFGSNPPNLNSHGNRGGLGGGGGGGPMAAMAAGGAQTATAVMMPPAPPKQAQRQKQGGILRGISTGLSDGLKSLTGAPNSSTQLREQSEFTARAQRERELMAQVQEAQKYAQMEHKKRQQLEAAYTATRNALTEAENARKGLKVKEELSQEMKEKIASLEKALNDRDVEAASGVFTNMNNNVVNKKGQVVPGWNDAGHKNDNKNGGGGGAAVNEVDVAGLQDRMAALESALEAASKGGNSASAGAGEIAAVTAMKGLQEKVKQLEMLWGQRNAAADAGTEALSKMDALAAQVQALQQLTSGEGYRSMVKDASGADLPPHVNDRVAMLEANLKAAAVDAAAVPELRKQVTELRDALKNVTNAHSSPNGVNSKSAGAANASLQAITDRVEKLEGSLSATEASPLSLDVLYAKVGAVEEGLAQTANGSAGLIQELQAKIKELEAQNGGGGIAGAVNGVLNKAFPPPAAAAAAPAPPKPAAPAKAPTKAPAFKTEIKPRPKTDSVPKPKTDVPPVNLPPDFTPAFVVDGGAVKKSGNLPAPAAPPAPAPQKQQEQVRIKDLPDDDDFVLEEGTLPRIASGREVMLQGFNWESHKFDWYNLVKERAGQISEAGFTQIWLPPCTDSLAPEGYLPRNLRSLETKYGGEAELRGLIAELRSNDVLPVLDAVLNHRCATHQGAGGKWNRWEGTGMDWGEWAITNRNKDFAGQGGDPTGDEFWGSPNIDHREPRVQEDICEWIKWLTHDVGFGGIRFDFSKGYGGEFTGTYTRACMPEFAVGEYWDTLDYGQGLEYDQDAHRQRIVDWVDQTGGICTAFDFTTKGILQEACGRGEFWRLVDKKGRAPGVIGLWPGRAVTFIDNHDTGSTQSHWPFPSNKVGMGYAYTLTHPGTPSVFWDHYFDWGDDLRNQLSGLMKAREDAGIHSRSKLEIVAATDSVYAALVGNRLAVKLGNDGWSPSGDGWNQTVSGDGWCVWTRGK